MTTTPSRPAADLAEPAATPRVGFRAHLTPYAIEGEALYLVAESGVSVVDGPLAGLLGPLLDGDRTREQVVEALDGRVPAERVHAAIDALVRAGYVGTRRPGTDPHESAYFSLASLDGDAAAAQVRGRLVDVEVHGDVDAAAMVGALRAAGVAVRVPDGEPGAVPPCAPDLVVVLTSDYLHPGLAARNGASLASGTPWLLVRPVGSMLWVGPVLDPAAEAGCWECLAHRLQGNRQSLTYLQQRLGAPEPIATGGAHLPSTVAAGVHLAAVEAVKWLGGVRSDAVVTTLDTVTLEAQRHELVRRPQCPACGDAQLMARRQDTPPVLTSRPKTFTTDGGHRSRSPEDMVATYGRQVSPVTGVVTRLVPAHGTPAGVKVYVAGQNLARQVSDLRMLKTGLRSLSCGKGMSDVQARASAMGEAIERYSGVFQGDEARITTSLAALGDDAIDPRSMLLFSDRQYDERDDWNARRSTFNSVPERFDPDARLEWTPAWSLTHDRKAYLPTAGAFYGYPQQGRFMINADSNGNAAGTSFEDAVLQGFLELVERDAVALWWYNRLQRPAVDLDAFDDPYVRQLQATYRGLHRDLWCLDLTSDFGIPVVGAFSRRTDKPVEDVLIAFGAHLDPRIALSRALSELNQFLGPVAGIGSDGSGSYVGADAEQIRWWTTATVATHPYLLPSGAPAATPSSWQPMARPDLREDVRLVADLVAAKGMEMFVLDQTRPDIGLPVVKVIVPGMRHFWARFAPGRLYDVPVALGWTGAPTPEADLNPFPIFI
ncbi:MAG: TOMM precursor leader peptide-binding protein [Kineosporiaceae bacterium]